MNRNALAAGVFLLAGLLVLIIAMSHQHKDVNHHKNTPHSTQIHKGHIPTVKVVKPTKRPKSNTSR